MVNLISQSTLYRKQRLQRVERIVVLSCGRTYSSFITNLIRSLNMTCCRASFL